MAGGARKLTLESIVGASAEQLSCEMSGEAVILNLKDCCYYGLDPVGACVWRALRNGPAPVAELRDRILTEFEVTPEQCEADLLQLLEEMQRTGLLEIRS